MGGNLDELAPDIEVQNYRGETLRLVELWRDGAVLLVFLRHLGCPLCFEHVRRIREYFERFRAAGIEIVAVAMGTAEQAAEFRASRQLACDVLADPELRAYRAFGLEQKGLWQIAGPQMWWTGFCSVARHGAGRPVGSIWQMPGAFLISGDGKVLYAHRSKHSGDLESYDRILERYKAASRTGNERPQTVGHA